MRKPKKAAAAEADRDDDAAANRGPLRDLSREAYDGLKEALSDEVFRNNERLTEVAIAERLGMSRTPVREAIQRLELEGLLVHEPRRGFSVPKLDHQMIVELYVIREMLEGSAARLAAQHASDVEIHTLRQLIEREKNEFANPTAMAALNRKIHGLIASSAHNRYLLRALSTIADTMILLPTTLTDRARAEASHREHREMLAAIEARDRDAAEQAARQHMRSAQQFRVARLMTDLYPD